MAGIPIMIARPFGSTARYWPGTIRRQPLFPKVSWCTWYHSQQAILQVLPTLDFIYHCFQTFKQLFQHQKKQSLPINQPIRIALAETAWKSGKHFNEDISKWRGQWQGGVSQHKCVTVALEPMFAPDASVSCHASLNRWLTSRQPVYLPPFNSSQTPPSLTLTDATKVDQPRSGPYWIGSGSEQVPRSVRAVIHAAKPFQRHSLPEDIQE